MNGSAIAQLYCLGGALIGFWIFHRFPDRAPRTLRGAVVAVVLAVALTTVVPDLLTALIERDGEAGAIVALLGLVLPTMIGVFWSAACLLRAFCGMMLGPR